MLGFAISERTMTRVTGRTTERGYSIREFNSRDLDSVMSLNRAFLPENYPSFFFLENSTRWPEAFLVAESDGEVVGYVMCRVEKRFHHLKAVKMGHVLSTAVEEKVRRRGIAFNLMISTERGLRESYDVDVIYLEVRVSNEPAMNLYKKLGYKTLGVIPRYYGDGEDGNLMTKAAKDWVTEEAVRSLLGHKIGGPR